VIDHAGLDRFALMAMSQGGPPSIEYTVRHPERVTRLIFYCSYAARLRNPSPDDLELDATFEQIIKVGWGRPESAFRRVFTSMMIPSATEEQVRWVDELLRVSTSPENALAARQQRRDADAVDLLPLIDAPTLVLHARHDRMNSFEGGRLLASMISGARLVVLESSNHILLGDEPAWPVFIDELAAFMNPDGRPAPVADAASVLSPRELAVLRLAAEGQDNAAIARSLTLSVRTVERHLQNLYAKLGVQGKAARAAAVARLLSRN
jgi:pimeloyl-ACP methyl ester carboxylesterase/DNA-binding CsgD family transcriptional regulator